MPLEPDQINKILNIFRDEFSEDQRERVARKLKEQGFTEDHIARFCKCKIGRLVPCEQTLGVRNALSNIEKGLNPLKTIYPN